MEYVRATRLLSHHVRLYLSDVLPLAHQTLHTSFQAVLLSLRLIYHLIRPLFTLLTLFYTLISPLFLRLLQRLWSLFALQPAEVLAVEAAIATILVFLSYLERRYALLKRLSRLATSSSRACRRRYRALIKSVKQQSRLAALALPHLIFLAAVSLVQATIAPYVASITRGTAMLFLACIRPAITTVLLLYAVEVHHNPTTSSVSSTSSHHLSPVPSPPTSPQSYPAPMLIDSTPSSQQQQHLRRRRSRASSTSTSTPSRPANALVAVSSTPLSRTKRELFRTPSAPGAPTVYDDDDIRDQLELRTLRFWVVFGIVWSFRSLFWYFSPSIMQSVVRSVHTFLFYFFLWAQIGMTCGADLIYAVATRIVRRKLKLRKEYGAARLNVIIRFAVAAGALSQERGQQISESMAEYGLALIGLVFLITPRVATFVGTVAIGLLVPCYLSMMTVEKGDGNGFGMHNWLCYWGVLAVIEAFMTALEDFCAWLPLWYHAKMVLILWLQLPYYRGCVVILDWVMDHIGVMLSTMKKQVVTPRKRKRA